MVKPKLRPLDIQPVSYKGESMWLLTDPLRLTDNHLVVPAGLTPLLVYSDGTREVAEIHAAFCRHVGEAVPLQVITNALTQLDQAYFLENERLHQLQQELLIAYRAQPFRPPALADLSYPGNPTQLADLLRHFAPDDNLNGWRPWTGRGLISPHIDYQRGGDVYARVWRRAAAAVAAADLVLIFGTDHNGGPGRITLTAQPYATPFGVLPDAPELVQAVAAAIGPEHAFAEELHHRQEHSVELSAVWLHHVALQAGVSPCPMLPILCGSFHHYVADGAHPDEDPRLATAIDALQQATAGQNVLAVASVDLAHVGPNFGDSFVMDAPRRQALAEEDRALMDTIVQGDAAGFYARVAAVSDRHRICGLSSIYLMLRYLQNDSGAVVAYEQCAADAEDHSLVSICGLLLD